MKLDPSMIDTQRRSSNESSLPVVRRLVLEHGPEGVIWRFFASESSLPPGCIGLDNGAEPVTSVLVPREAMSQMVELLQNEPDVEAEEKLRLEAQSLLPSEEVMRELVRRSPPLSEWTE